MPISATIRLLAAAAVIVPIAAACSPNEPVATEPGTTPPVWTGSPSPTPSGEAAEGSGATGGETLTANLAAADGTEVATATIEFTDGFATVTVETTTAGELTPGFHGLHIHQVGSCEGDFTSAGGHFQAEGHSGHPSSGDLSSLQVRSDGSAKLVTTTDACGHLARDVLELSRPEVGELSEGRGGRSSSMPHKANPVLSVLIRRCALTTPLLAATLHLSAADQVDERADGAWHAEWDTLRILVRRTAVAASQTADLVESVQVHPDRMTANLSAAEAAR